ncbi:MAG: FecR domain-containing protein [Saprospiraceae bacterium]
MKNYLPFQLEDFVCDEFFIDWCLTSSAETNIFWNEYIQSHPDQKATILQARQLVLDLNKLEKTKEKQHITGMGEAVWSKIEDHMSKPAVPLRVHSRYQMIIAVAAVGALLLGALLWLQKPTISHDKQLSTSAKTEWINYENDNGLPATITLPDASTVTLAPFSYLKYPIAFSEEQRKVFLKGEAFFEVTRDTLKPFMVFANETITSVLGTSFRITAFEGDENVEVEVKTGRVAVYAQVASNVESTESKEMIVMADERIVMKRPNKKLEITPNQKVVFNRKGEEMVKTITSLPQLIVKIEELPQFQFIDESVVKVFHMLETAYGIDLEFDTEKLANCTIRATLDDEPLLEKLNIICLALDLTFLEKDAVIYIDGDGC